jgi:GT2 family glycosyltransferase
MFPKVCFIIVTFNGEKWIRKCLSSLELSKVHVDAIVIDNGSTDGTQDIIRNDFPNVQFLQLEQNLGFGAANNIGIKMALENGSDYAFLLNQDAWLIDNALSTLIQMHQKYPSFGIISPIHVNASRTALDYNFSTYLVPDKAELFYSDLFFNKLKEIYEVEFVNAAGWLIPRDCLSKIGYFDSLFFHYCEDKNYCHRILYHGYKIGVCPSAIMVHDRGERKGVATAFAGRRHLRMETIAKYADVRLKNFERKYRQFIFQELKLSLKTFLTFNFAAFKDHYSDWLFFLNLKDKIKKSRQKNSKLITSNA